MLPRRRPGATPTLPGSYQVRRRTSRAAGAGSAATLRTRVDHDVTPTPEDAAPRIDPEQFVAELRNAGVTLVSGVPDSLLAPFLSACADGFGPERHHLAVNEGCAVAVAAGHHLATGSVPLVYFQNSGLGNATNPLLSLADPDVYGLPMVLLVGWRGEPGRHDEPQHVAQGRVTTDVLTAMGVPHRLLAADGDVAGRAALRWALAAARERAGPVALLVRRGAFAPRAGAAPGDTAAVPGDTAAAPGDTATAPGAGSDPSLTRRRAIEAVIDALGPEVVVVATTGKAGRELFAVRRERGHDDARDLLTVGSMGHASQIALGLARARPDLQVVCLDGDGAALMHLGGLASVGTSACANLLHVVLNNGAHDSVGGQPTVALAIDLVAIARGCGYAAAHGPFGDPARITATVRSWLHGGGGPVFLEARVARGARSDLGRPDRPPRAAGARLMAALAAAVPADRRLR